MDLVEQVETTRFLGREFLVWLWFKTELFQATLSTKDGLALEIWLDSQLVLQSVSDVGERTTMRGVAPSGTVEAKVAIERGKMPTKARLNVSLDGKDFTFLFDAMTFGLTTVKLPDVLTDDGDERVSERMQLLSTLDDVMREQYREFLAIRISPLWDAEFVPAVVTWSQGEEGLSERAYRGLLQRAEGGRRAQS